MNARHRIGNGPWVNVRGELIARNVQELHGENRITKQTALTEKGAVVNGRGDTPNIHDILTGSQPDGTAFAGSEDRTCGNRTVQWGESPARRWSVTTTGSAWRDDAPSKSWNSSHPSRGCGVEALKATGGGGLLYCFAAR